MKPDLRKIFSRFITEGTYLSGESFGPGHIHDTYRIITAEKDCNDYILQRINSNVFSNVPELQDNIERVTSHLQNKISIIPDSDVRRECLTLIPSVTTGRSWFIDEEGSFWRMFLFISDHRSYERVDSHHKAFEGGRAVGRFQTLLADLPGPPLHETIPDFHNIEKRLETFHRVITLDRAGRVSSAAREIEEIMKREEQMKIIIRLGREGKIPLRITHNDTKFNNILFDCNDRALCIIDLDTVMPGYVHYDFGDAIRTAANTSAEDTDDLASVSMDPGIFEAYARGYLSEAAGTLNTTEKEYLAFAPGLLTYIMATRFLTDYLDGDSYYKIKYPGHNLQRNKAQVALLKSMENQYVTMKKIIKNILK